MITIRELNDYLDENKEKIFEISFGEHWVQVPFGLVGDMVKKMIDYANSDIEGEA